MLLDVGDLRGQVRGHPRFEMRLPGSRRAETRRLDRLRKPPGVVARAPPLRFTGAGRGQTFHGCGDGVGDQEQPDALRGDPPLGEASISLDNGVRVGLEHAVGVVEGAGLVHHELYRFSPDAADPRSGIGLGAASGGPIGARGQKGQRTGYILAVLAAAGVRAVGGGRYRKNATGPAIGQSAQGLGDEGVPVAIADDHGQVRTAGGELGAQGGQELLIAVVYRRDTAETAVMAGHLQKAGIRNAAPRGGVAHEGQDVVGTLGAAVGEQQDGVVGGQWITHARPPDSPWAPRPDGPDSPESPENPAKSSTSRSSGTAAGPSGPPGSPEPHGSSSRSAAVEGSCPTGIVGRSAGPEARSALRSSQDPPWAGQEAGGPPPRSPAAISEPSTRPRA